MSADLQRVIDALVREQSQPVETRHVVAIAVAKKKSRIARADALIAAGRRVQRGEHA